MVTRTVTVWVDVELNASIDAVVSDASIFVDRPITAVVDATIEPIALNARFTKTRQQVGDSVGWWWQQYVARHEALRKVPKELTGYVNSPLGIPYGEFTVIEIVNIVESPVAVVSAEGVIGYAARSKAILPDDSILTTGVQGATAVARIENAIPQIYSLAITPATISTNINLPRVTLRSSGTTYRSLSVGIETSIEYISANIVSYGRIRAQIQIANDLVSAVVNYGISGRGSIVDPEIAINVESKLVRIAHSNIIAGISMPAALIRFECPTNFISSKIVSILGTISARAKVISREFTIGQVSIANCVSDRVISAGYQSSPRLICSGKFIQPSASIISRGEHDPDDEDALNVVLLAA